MGEKFEPGIYDLPEDRYRAADHIANSDLGRLKKSPAHFQVGSIPTTSAMLFGTAVHTAVLTPDLFQDEYIVSPSNIDRRTKKGKADWKAFLEEAGDRQILSQIEYNQIQRITDAVMEHPTAFDLLTDGKPEQSVFWHWDGVDCKCRVDWARNDGILVDLKTTKSAHPDDFTKSVYNFGYHRQAAFYLDGTSEVTGEPYDQFYFIAVEKVKPYAVAVYQLEDFWIEAGRREYIELLEQYWYCSEYDDWSAYGTDIIVLGVPKWIQNRLS